MLQGKTMFGGIEIFAIIDEKIDLSNIPKNVILSYKVITAEYYLMHRQYHLSDEIYMDYLEDAKFLYGEQGAPTLLIAKGLAKSYAFKKKYLEAEEILLDIIVKMKESLGPTHTITIETMNQLSNVYAGCDRITEAIEMKEKCCQTMVANTGLANTLTVSMLTELADIYAKLGMYDNAEKLLNGALAAVIKQFGEYYDDTINIIFC